MASTDSRRLAVLIDADNTPPGAAGDVLEELAKHGRLTVKRAYGDWTTPNLGGWKTALLGHGIQPAMQGIYEGIEETLRHELARVTLEKVLRDVLAAPRRPL